MNTDPIADLLTRIRNASRAGKKSVAIPHSKLKEELAKVLESEGIITKTRINRSGKFSEILVTLKEDKKNIDLSRISKPGQRVYKKADQIRPVRNGFGISVLSTSQGLLTGDKAKELGIGGEVLCEVF